jgi:FemAB family
MKATKIEIDWHPALPIYASEPFLRAVSNQYGWIGGIDGSGELRCVLPYTVVRKAILRMVRFRVETIALGRELVLEEEKSFLNSAVAYLRSTGADLIIPATTNTIFRTWPEGAIAAPYGTYVIDLTQNEESIWGNLSSSHRRKIRLAMKEGVEIRNGLRYLETAYALIRETFKRSKLPFMGIAAFKRMLGGLGNNVKIFVADYRGVIQGCTVIPFSEYGAYYVYGGSVADPAVGAMNLMHWEAIRLFRSQGVKRYDFVGSRIKPEKGSKQEGIKTFKERFGGRLVEGYLWKYSFHPLKCLAYSLAARVRTGGDIVDQERRRSSNGSEVKPH